MEYHLKWDFNVKFKRALLHEHDLDLTENQRTFKITQTCVKLEMGWRLQFLNMRAYYRQLSAMTRFYNLHPACQQI